jgi:hypothetical protein
VVTFWAKVTPSHPCGRITVQAKVLHAHRDRTFTVTAVAHFFGGNNVSIDLRRSGHSYVAVGRIPVPADQPAGPVTVDITITYDGTSTPLSRTSMIRIPVVETPSPSPSPTPTATP